MNIRKRRKKRHVIIAVMSRRMGETRHRGRTLRAALKSAEETHVPVRCNVKWYWGAHKGAGGVVKKRGIGKASSVILDGELFCPGKHPSSIYGTVLQGRTFARAEWLDPRRKR